LHALGGALTFPAWVLGVFLFSLSVRRDHRWRRGSGSLLALSAISIVGFLFSILSLIVLGFAGYAQRLLVAVLFIWMIVMALYMIRRPHDISAQGVQPNRPLQPPSGAGGHS
jgi:4-hydroxybenzoate polyprenyltransferase